MIKNFEERVSKNMKLFHISRDEAVKMVNDDDLIDHGGKADWEVEMTPEQKKAQRAARTADRPVKAEKQPRTKTENPDKRELMSTIGAAIGTLDDVDDIDIVNPEREMVFTFNGVKYKIVLSAPRN